MQKKKYSLAYLLLIITFFALLSGCLEDFIVSGPEDTSFEKVKITRVIDGDTAYARFADGREEKVRFIGVDAPEINHPTRGIEIYGPEAEEYARSRLAGATVWFEYDIGTHDQYERLLAYVWLTIPDNFSDSEIRDKLFNAQLLLEGYAVQVIFEPNVKYVDFFAEYEKEARLNKRGLWGSNN